MFLNDLIIPIASQNIILDDMPKYEPPPRMTMNNIRANKPTLDKEHMQAIDDLGFGGLTKMNGVQIRRLLCKQIARQDNEQTRAFNINGIMLEINHLK
uniref:Uncharacterized protein n=1 Tax=Oryza meridionalis TaxID=40149 RepID=A0A0E0D134_9ORYZ